MLRSKVNRKSASSHKASITRPQYSERVQLQHSSRRSCWEPLGLKGHHDIILFGLSLLPYVATCVLRLMSSATSKQAEFGPQQLCGIHRKVMSHSESWMRNSKHFWYFNSQFLFWPQNITSIQLHRFNKWIFLSCHSDESHWKSSYKLVNGQMDYFRGQDWRLMLNSKL